MQGKGAVMAGKGKGMVPHEAFHEKVVAFAKSVTAKFEARAKGEPEDQLKPPVDRLFTEYGALISAKIVLKGESALGDRLGQPDFAAHDKAMLIGYIELKAPGKGANPELYKGHDKEQWKRFQNVPNMLYTDGNEWGLYQDGELVGKRVRLAGDVRTDGRKAATKENAAELFQVFAQFSSWSPIVPKKAKALAGFLAPYCRLIREEVMDALADAESPMQALKREIKQLLFPEADDMHFADAYAQTVIFALLLAQIEGADVLVLQGAYDKLADHHLLLSRSLQFLTDPEALKEISASVALAQRVIHEIPKSALKAKKAAEDPWLFFYEEFLAAYDPKLRKETGVYYTPLEVVNCQVRLIDEILHMHLGKEMGFVEPGVATLDPAVGTGTYLLGIIEHALKRVAEEEGPGAVKSGARALVHNLHGFEWMVGPYSVAQLRFSRALTMHGTSLPAGGPGIYLTNTLESPHTKPPAPPLFHRPIAQEHERALKVKDAEHVLVCLGNPPYGRHEAVTADNHACTGGWVRHGAEGERPILEDFLEPARKAGFGVHLKNLYNHYVYFIRWSLWKVFEHKTATGPGIVSFITASSYLDGDAFAGLREHMRRICDHIDIIDLGGEGRGTRQDENIFAIQTPVAIFVAWRKGQGDRDRPAAVRYARVEGTKEQKRAALECVRTAGDVKWQVIAEGWQGPFRPRVTGAFAVWPKIANCLPWQSNGVQCKRTWVIAPSKAVLEARWKGLLRTEDRGAAMKESGDRTVSLAVFDIFDQSRKLAPIESLSKDEQIHGVVPYAYRSFDQQCLLADNRLISRPRPPLWQAHGDRQVYLTSLFSIPLDKGPAAVACSEIPDLDSFRGSYGAKAVLPLFRDREGTEPNILPGLLEFLAETCGKRVLAEQFAGYVYAVLGHPGYTVRFAEELVNCEVRVPLTKDGGLFFKAAAFGQRLIWLHTYGERMTGRDRPKGKVPKGEAKCLKAVGDSEAGYPEDFVYDAATETLHVGEGTFKPVSREVFEFEVSGLQVVKSWLGYRMKKRSGRRSSPLDDIRPTVWTHAFTRDLLELLWVLEHTIAGYPEQQALFEAILESELFTEDELPDVPEEARRPPRAEKAEGEEDLLFGEDD
jgi:hypothetical protein